MLYIMDECTCSNAIILKSFYEDKKLVPKLGFISKKIDYCKNGFMPYYKDINGLDSCKICNASRYKLQLAIGRSNDKLILVKMMHYMPLIHHFKRPFASTSLAPYMMWSYDNKRLGRIIYHPSNGNTWKEFDNLHLAFTTEQRNVRLGFCTDGFSPFNQGFSPYSC